MKIPEESAIRMAEELYELELQRKKLNGKIAELFMFLIKNCPHPQFFISSRKRACAEDDGPFDTCLVCRQGIYQ